MSVCSHGILAIAMEIYKKGASTSAVIAFLLASPWANLPLTILLLGFFGLKALFFIFGAIGIAIVTGLIFQLLEKANLVESNPIQHPEHETLSIQEDLKKNRDAFRFTQKNIALHIKGIGQGAFSLADMVLWWVILGAVIASAAGAYIPTSIFQNYMGPTLLGLLVTLLIATVLEVCSEGTAPLAFEIYRQTGAFGNAFVFLMAGVVTDYTEIGLLWQNIGKRTAIMLPIIAVPQVIILGIIANHIF
jgi:hypothetical protein